MALQKIWIVIIFIGLLFMIPASSAGTNTTEVPPVADFSVSYVPAPAPVTVEFRQNSSGTITQYDWNFGDGTRSIDPGPNHIHTYWKDGNYTVSLTVVGSGGNSTKISPLRIGGSYSITFNPIGSRFVGDTFNLSGETNRPVGTEFVYSITLADWVGGPRNSPYWNSRASGSTTVISSVGRNNNWSFPLNTTGLLPGDYRVDISPQTGSQSPYGYEYQDAPIHFQFSLINNSLREPTANSFPVATISMNGTPTSSQSIPAPLSPALMLLALGGTGALVIRRQKR